jgi:S-formylglutathione hydrolase FrmB
MGRSFPALIALPGDYNQVFNRYPVLYLLHGHSSHYKGWLDIADNLKDWADTYQMIIVCPDGDRDSWYINSPVEKHRRFETFISNELTSYIDRHYKTKARSKYRGISGVSMGGHGALYNAMKHPDIFGVAASSSGGLDLLPFYNHWNLQEILGKFPDHVEQWKRFSCMYLLDNLNGLDSVHTKPSDKNYISFNAMQIWLDCGTEDFFLEVNRQFRQKLLEKGIRHQYHEFPGGHTLEYWKESYKKQIIFFADRFRN